jgi:N-ethylmaleimide reductase
MTGGVPPVAPSVVPFEGVAFTEVGWVPCSLHRALEAEEIPEIVGDYRKAAERAEAAGFDGVELHAGNGYLLDQFLQDGTNRRTDAYGGPVENRARLLFETYEEAAAVWGADRVGVRISPSTQFNAMSDSDPAALFGHVATRLDGYKPAYLHIIEPRIKGSVAVADGLPAVAAAQLREVFEGPIISAGGFEPESAGAILERREADLVAFGRHFISNPDLPRRIALGLPLAPYDRGTFYGGNAHGYTDYPFASV